MKVSITRKHILCGVAGSATNCPLSLALKDATGKQFRVGLFSFYDTAKYAGALPHGAEKFRRDFDSGRQVAPFTVEFPDL